MVERKKEVRKLGDICNGRVSHVEKCVWSEKISVESKERVVGLVIGPKKEQPLCLIRVIYCFLR